MIAYFVMQLAPLIYGALYLIHSLRRRRFRQAATVGALLLLTIAALAVLLYRFFHA